MYYYTIKKIIRMLTAAVLALALSACSFRGKVALQPTETTSPLISLENGENSKDSSLSTETASAKDTASSFDLTGPWHLDERICDLDYLAEAFPGYAEWGASMEIRSNGQISWYIGAEGWTGSWELDDSELRAYMTADLDRTEKIWNFLLLEENGNASLKVDYKGISIVWVYGDQEDLPTGNSANG